MTSNDVSAGPPFSVMVFDMAHTGEPDGERLISGFADEAAAQAYAEARMRDSLEELREPGQSHEDLSRLWHIYGEDCVVVGGAFKGRDHLARFIASPATATQRAWSAMTPAPRPKRFRVVVLISNRDGESVWAGGLLRRVERPTPAELLTHYAEDARQAFRRGGIEPDEPDSINVANLRELRDAPRPPAGQALLSWAVSVDFVCHDIKFGAASEGIFAWPVKPEGSVLWAMAAVVVSDAIALRGDDPANVEYSDFLAIGVEPSDEPWQYPID